MAVPKSKHKVYMYRNDYNAMCSEVYNHQHIETGGNLFGLWTTSGSAVIHVVLGPGKDCKRTSTSFHQDLEYMARVGGFVNEDYMLCHIGEWHSHHNLSLDKPSAGDESTIRRNFPQGVSKFLVIIANIRNGDTIKLSPYFFTDGGQRYEIAKCEVLQTDGPFSTDKKIAEAIQLGSEEKENQKKREDANHSGRTFLRNAANEQYTSYNTEQDGNINRLQANQSSSLAGLHTFGSKSNPSFPITLLTLSTTTTKSNQSLSDSLVNSNAPTSNTNLRHVDSGTTNSKPNQSTSDVHETASESNVNQSLSKSQSNSSGSASNDREEPMDTEDSDLHPRGDHERSNIENGTSSSHPSGQADPDRNTNEYQGTAASVRDIILKKIHDQLKNWFGNQAESMFTFETSKSSPDTIEISFKHSRKYWIVRFPEDFPIKSAELFCSAYRESVNVCKVYKNDIVGPLNNDVNILLSIKKRCDSSSCNVCKQFTKESLCQSSINTQAMKNVQASVTKLANDITASLALTEVVDLKTKCLSSSQGEITFKHGRLYWIIEVSAYFPDVPASLYYLQFERSSQKHDVILPGEYSSGPQALNTTELIIKAIHLNCYCTPCLNKRP